MVVSLGVLVGVAPTVALWVLLLIFGIKTSRGCKLESLPWLGVYIISTVGLALAWPVLMAQVVSSIQEAIQYRQGEGDPFGLTLGELQVTLAYCGTFFSNSARLVLGTLILADIAFLLSKAGAAMEGKFLNSLLRVRECSNTWGIVMLILLLSKAALGMMLYLYYV